MNTNFRKIDSFEQACKEGDSEIALSLFTKHEEYAKIVIRYGVDKLYHLVGDFDCFDGIEYAVKVKNKSYIKKIITTYPTEWQFNIALRVGLVKEAYEIKDKLVEEKTRFNHAGPIEATVEADDMELYRIMKGMTYRWNWVSVCEAAAKANNMEIIQEKLKDLDVRDLRDLACCAAEGGHKEMVDYLLERATEKVGKPMKRNSFFTEKPYKVEPIAAKAHKMYLLLNSDVHKSIFDSLTDRCSKSFLLSCAIKRNDRDYVEKNMVYDSSLLTDVMKSGNMIDIVLPLEKDWETIVKAAARGGRVKIIEDTIRSRLESRTDLGNRSKNELIAIIHYMEGDKDEAVNSVVKVIIEYLYSPHPDTKSYFGIPLDQDESDED